MQGLPGTSCTCARAMALTPGSDVGMLPSDGFGQVAYVVSGLSLSATYYFAVSSYDADGHGQFLVERAVVASIATATPTSTLTVTAARTVTPDLTVPVAMSATPTQTSTSLRPRLQAIRRPWLRALFRAGGRLRLRGEQWQHGARRLRSRQ